jgi:uncharacterized FlaG/YvyC family protein
MTYTNPIQSDIKVDGPVVVRRPDRRERGDPVGHSLDRTTVYPDQVEQSPGDSLNQEINDSLVALNEALKSSDKTLNISVDSATGTAIFRIVDTTTGEVVLQVPSKLTAGISKALMMRRGVLLDSNQ